MVIAAGLYTCVCQIMPCWHDCALSGNKEAFFSWLVFTLYFLKIKKCFDWHEVNLRRRDRESRGSQDQTLSGHFALQCFIFFAGSSSEFLTHCTAIKARTKEWRKGSFLLSLVGVLNVLFTTTKGGESLEGAIRIKPAEDEIIKQDTMQEVHWDEILMSVSTKPVDH